MVVVGRAVGLASGLGPASGDLLPGLVLVVRVLFHVEQSQSLGFLNVGILAVLTQLFPLFSQILGNFRVVNVGLVLHNLFALDVGEHHEGIHGPFDSIHGLLFSLEKRKKNKADYFI